MRIIKLLHVLSEIKLLSPVGVYRLLSAFYKSGINLMTLLDFAGRTYGNRIALVDDNETLTYKELLLESENLAVVLKGNMHIGSGQKVGLLCHNQASFITSMFAVSRLGADLYLLNTEISSSQLSGFLLQQKLDVLIFDVELTTLVEESGFNNTKILSTHCEFPAINHIQNHGSKKIPRTTMSKIVLQTGGTTGISKEAAHKPSVFNYLNPFLALFNKFNMLERQTAYIATPIYHGYGLGILLLFLALGKKIVVSKGFDSHRACDIIRTHQVEVVTVVPLMLHKMLNHSVESLQSLKCIASGGAKLSSKLIEETRNKLGDVLFNLYGTSEAGLNVIATPHDLRYSSTSIGKKIKGVQLKVMSKNMKEVRVGEIGHFCITNDWSIRNKKNGWIQTGDVGFCDEQGYYFLLGRTDDMVVSGGENVYPIEVEQVLITHHAIEDVAVIGVMDEQFGERLKAFILPIKNATITDEEITTWLRSRVARFQMPKEIMLVEEMPYTSLGKIDKKLLKIK
ncbi:MAG: AMP-binding protein [Planococcaceae bacterium]|nr:AMP-binding protein [Planococcaceae bacterium]